MTDIVYPPHDILNRKNETKNIFSSKSWRAADYFYEAFLRGG